MPFKNSISGSVFKLNLSVFGRSSTLYGSPRIALFLELSVKKVLHVGLRLNIALHYCQERKLLRHLDCKFALKKTLIFLSQFSVINLSERKLYLDHKRISDSTCHVFLCDRRTSKIFEAELIRPSDRTSVHSPQQEAGEAVIFTFYHLVTDEVWKLLGG